MNLLFFFQLKLRVFFKLLTEANLGFSNSFQLSHKVSNLFTRKKGKHALEREVEWTFRGIPSTGL